MMKKILLVFHTIKYLKFLQLFFQIYYRLTLPKLRSLPQISFREKHSKFNFPAFKELSSYDGNRFTFLGVTADLSKGWNDDALPKLWLYNLHYQDDLTSIGANDRLDLNAKLINSWFANNPPVNGNGWEPYCISLRVVNWIKYFNSVDKSNIDPKWTVSLAQQVDLLTQRLEFHILANHLFANAKALIFAGTYFGGDLGRNWLKRGLKLLDTELNIQFLDDGGHFELSPMYHSILLWDIADLISLARIYNLPDLSSRVGSWINVYQRGVSWLTDMLHPDGDISFFNDSTFGIAPTYEDIKNYSVSLGISLPVSNTPSFEARMLAQTGYCTIDWPCNSRLIADIGKVGPDYQPGHAHADTLSCELSILGRRVFVNSGISQYGVDLERHRQRSTSAHNTISVNGENSTEVWAGFRVSRRASPLDITCSKYDDLIELEASHNGYHRLKNKVTHQRKWSASEGFLRIEDHLSGSFRAACGYWYLHPEIHVSMVTESIVGLELSCGHKFILTITGAELSIEDTTWHPGFGLSVPNKKIVFNFKGPHVTTELKWS